MFTKTITKALELKDNFSFRNYVYFDKENKSYVATDGHKMFIEKTTDIYDSDCYLSPRTGAVADYDCKYAEWTRVVYDGEPITDREFRTYTRKEKSKNAANKIIFFAGDYYNADFIKDAFAFIGAEFSLSFYKNILRIDSKDGQRIAIVIALRFDADNYIEDKEKYKPEDTKQKLTKAKYVWLAYDKDGRVLGVFTKRTDAAAEGVNFEEYPIL